MDRVYKADIPNYKRVLKELKIEFARLNLSTDWVRLRIEPLLTHIESLDMRLRSPLFAKETARLRKGVAMFHADLVYLRANIKALKAILADEKPKRAPFRGRRT